MCEDKQLANGPVRGGGHWAWGGGVCERISKVGTSHDAEILIGTLSNFDILGGSFLDHFFGNPRLTIMK